MPIFEPEGANIRAPQTSRRDLFEASKLSRLPSLKSVRTITEKLCANCDGKLNPAVEFQATVSLCGECLKTYAAVGVILDKYTEAKIRRNYFRGEKG